MATPVRTLTASELRKLDASYRPFPSLESWTEHGVRAEFGRYAEELNLVRANVDEVAFEQALDAALRAAAFDTGAIEGLYQTDRGLTLTVAQAQEGWEDQVREKQSAGRTSGDDALALFKAQLEAYELARDVASERYPASEAWVRRLHEVATAPQQTYEVHTAIGPQHHQLPKGEYKTQPNHVLLKDGTWHAYCPVEKVGDEMSRLVNDLRSAEFGELHWVLQAAYAHYAFVVIHPFADGNGRVARVLASVYLLGAFDVPLIVYADQRDQYIDALESADNGVLVPFSQFMESAVREGILDVRSALLGGGQRPQEEIEKELREMLIARMGMTHRELDSMAATVYNRVAEKFGDAVGSWNLQAGVTLDFHNTRRRVQPPPGYRTPIGGEVQAVVLRGHSEKPYELSVDTAVDCFIAADEEQPFDVIFVFDPTGDSEGLTNDVIAAWPRNVNERFDRFVERSIHHNVEGILQGVKRQQSAQGDT